MPPPIKYKLRRNRFAKKICLKKRIGLCQLRGCFDIICDARMVKVNKQIPADTFLGYVAPCGKYYHSIKLVKAKEKKLTNITCFRHKITGECIMSSSDNELHFSLIVKNTTVESDSNIIVEDDSRIVSRCNLKKGDQLVMYMNNFEVLRFNDGTNIANLDLKKGASEMKDGGESVLESVNHQAKPDTVTSSYPQTKQGVVSDLTSSLVSEVNLKESSPLSGSCFRQGGDDVFSLSEEVEELQDEDLCLFSSQDIDDFFVSCD